MQKECKIKVPLTINAPRRDSAASLISAIKDGTVSPSVASPTSTTKYRRLANQLREQKRKEELARAEAMKTYSVPKNGLNVPLSTKIAARNEWHARADLLQVLSDDVSAAKKAQIIAEKAPELERQMTKEHAGASVKRQPKPMRSEARYLQKLFKVNLPVPEEPTVGANERARSQTKV